MTDINVLEELKILVVEYDRARFTWEGPRNSMELRNQILFLFNKLGLEYCAHNLAILGAPGYKKFQLPNNDTLWTKQAYAKAIENQEPTFLGQFSIEKE